MKLFLGSAHSVETLYLLVEEEVYILFVILCFVEVYDCFTIFQGVFRSRRIYGYDVRRHQYGTLQSTCRPFVSVVERLQPRNIAMQKNSPLQRILVQILFVENSAENTSDGISVYWRLIFSTHYLHWHISELSSIIRFQQFIGQ